MNVFPYTYPALFTNRLTYEDNCLLNKFQSFYFTYLKKNKKNYEITHCQRIFNNHDKTSKVTKLKINLKTTTLLINVSYSVLQI